MNAKQLSAQVVLINDKLKFECAVPGRAPLTVDYAKPHGDGEGIMSLELLLMSLATCFGSSLKVVLAAHQKNELRMLEIHASGIRKDTHPTAFETIRLAVRLDANSLAPETVRTTIEKAKQICPVFVMLKDGVEISIEVQPV